MTMDPVERLKQAQGDLAGPVPLERIYATMALRLFAEGSGGPGAARRQRRRVGWAVAGGVLAAGAAATALAVALPHWLPLTLDPAVPSATSSAALTAITCLGTEPAPAFEGLIIQVTNDPAVRPDSLWAGSTDGCYELSTTPSQSVAVAPGTAGQVSLTTVLGDADRVVDQSVPASAVTSVWPQPGRVSFLAQLAEFTAVAQAGVSRDGYTFEGDDGGRWLATAPAPAEGVGLTKVWVDPDSGLPVALEWGASPDLAGAEGFYAGPDTVEWFEDTEANRAAYLLPDRPN
ncbi:MAG: hypothetical protein LBR19_07275 [Bifidobacteriaceae bacterium]|jgi:hypothetical protein|nr:hypothetical protein [Bifidobacteriaceae bacterium]